jgi:hypothetical protein
VEIFCATLDTQLFELNCRFNEKVMDLLSTSATFIPRNKFRGFKDSDICEMVKKYYPARFLPTRQLKLFFFASDASKDDELRNISNLIGLFQCLVETGRHAIFNFLERLLRLLRNKMENISNLIGLFQFQKGVSKQGYVIRWKTTILPMVC